jgi:hypothetical protein
MSKDKSSHIPPGWGYDPASWSQRLPIVALALVGFGIATYLALWQYDVFKTAWEPFFDAPDVPDKNGTEVILSSRLSYPFKKLMGLPIPFRISDAALGAFAYLLDALTGLWGGRGRWRRMPWIVIIFAILVGPLGAVSVGLVISQPLIEGQWCTLCLASAVVSALMIGPAMDEALSSFQYLKRVKDDPNRSAWKAFWGIDADGKLHLW